MTVRDVDVVYDFDDPDDGWFGQALPVESMVPVGTVQPQTPDYPVDSVRYADERPPADAVPGTAPSSGEESVDGPASDCSDDTDRWYVQDLHRALTSDESVVDEPRGPVFADQSMSGGPVAARNPVSWESKSWEPRSWESRLSRSGAWDFQVSSSTPWYRSRRFLAIAAALVIAGVVVAAVLVLRSPSPAVDDTTIAPPEPTAQPIQTSIAPTPSASSDVPLPPPPEAPLPPPPPPVDPSITRQYTPPQRQPSSESKRPEINVTRTPMSATPPPPPRPDRNSSAPGDAPKRGGWGF